MSSKIKQHVKGGKDSSKELAPIGAKGTNVGQFVLDGQELATKEGFSRVAKEWYNTFQPLSFALERIDANHKQSMDVDAVFGDDKDVRPIISEESNQFRLLYEGEEYRPTPHALNYLSMRFRDDDNKQLGSLAVANELLGVDINTEDENQFEYRRDRKYQEMYIQYLKYLLNDSRHNEDPFFWRFNTVRKEVRAVFTSANRTANKGAPYRPINNSWLMELISDIVPDGMISHWRGNCDTVRTNVYVPDCDMSDNGENYGGGISIGNSEIGELMLSVCPFTYCATCRNGNIWDRKNGSAVRVSHRAKNIDLESLAKEIRENIRIQLDLIPKNLEKFLGTKRMKWEGASVVPMIAQAARQYNLTRTQAMRALDAYGVEVREKDENRNNLYGLVNSLSRAAQGWNNETEGMQKGFEGKAWESLSKASADMIEFSQERFDKFTASAFSMDEKEVSKYLALVN